MIFVYIFKYIYVDKEIKFWGLKFFKYIFFEILKDIFVRDS